MNRLTLCQGGQEARCSGAARAARRGSWQRQGTTSTGFRVLSCARRHESGTAGRYKKGKKHWVCLCVTGGIEAREAQSF